MPRTSSAWVDLRIHLVIVAGLLVVLMIYNKYVAFIGFVLMVTLFFYGRERCKDRQAAMDEYFNTVVRNINQLSNYAIENLPIAIMILRQDGRMQWCNRELVQWFGEKPEIGTSLTKYWETFDIESIWGEDGQQIFQYEDKYYEIKYRMIFNENIDVEGIMVCYMMDVTELEELKIKNHMSDYVFSYIQIDNYDEVLQGLSEAQRTAILIEINQCLDDWINSVGSYIRRFTKDMYIAILDRRALEEILEEKFEILDKVRAIHGANKFPVTLSIGVAVDAEMSLSQLGENAKAGLDLALGRGGDQVAVYLDGKMQFYGGKSKAVEKHTRVKARVVAHALSEIIENADAVLIMGHHNEDFDSLGAAMGVAKMARYLGKPVHIILSDMNEGIDKITDLLNGIPEYDDLFVDASDIGTINALQPVLFVVDTHIPNMTAAPELLDKIEHKIVIDHHRRSEHFIANPLLVYTEPSSSSTSELVTELLMYFSDDIDLSRMEATSLYAGIIVDTKNFAVQTGVRTFDAAAYLRRSGADPAIVHSLFKVDYESALAKASTLSNAQYFAGGLLVASCPRDIQNIQVIAAQVADGMLRIEDVRMSVVLFHAEDDSIGVSARSTGEINVQVIMEHFGGGGHQNVAGTQVRDISLEELKQQIIDYSVEFIKEIEEDESNITTRS